MQAVHAARNGDARAFARLHEHFLPALRRLAVRRTHCADTADECIQEAMLRAWQSLDRFEGGADDFAGWLARIVINACIDRGRHERRRPPTTSMEVMLDGDECERHLADCRPTLDHAVETAILREKVDAAIDGVAEPFRTVLELDRRGCTYAEMAAVLDVPLGTVRSRLSRARLRARALLADVGPLTIAPGAGTRWSVPPPTRNAAILTASIELSAWCGRPCPRCLPSRR